ncbi:MAG: 4-carboxy-4-hydroxy-2-oxoadipate aldolase/oxaloacetate decarboxylase [Candidatus Parvarchaeota archaeon]
MRFEIIKNIERDNNDLEYSRKLAEYGVATVCEAQGKTGVMLDYMRPIQHGVSVAGRAITVECTAADNLMIHAALEICHKGDILVVSTPKETRNGYFGELMANSAMSKGVSALIIDGGIRDSESIRKLKFPVWCKYIYAVGTTKKNPGNINKEIKCGGISISGGDFVVADDDGVVVVKKEMLKSVIEKAQERVEKEVITRNKIKSGELAIDFYNLRPVLSELGVEYTEKGDK